MATLILARSWRPSLLLGMGVAVLPGCATITGSETQNISIQATDASGAPVAGAECKFTNDKGTWRAKPPAIAVVVRSAEDLLVQCEAERQAAGTLRAISRANSGMIGNIIFGGGIGAMIDHSKGTAYDYPSMLRVIFGATLVVDKKDEQGDAPKNPAPPAGTMSAAAPASPPATALAPAARSANPTSPGMPATGTTFRYAWTDRQYSRQQEFVVRVLAVDGWRISESFEPRGTGPTEAAIDARRAEFLGRRLAEGQGLLEFSPYLGAIAAAGRRPQPDPEGYPTGGLDAWNIAAGARNWDDIDVPAGRFRALRFEIRGHRRTLTTAYSRQAIAEKFVYDVWYAPELKRYVKLRHRQWNGFDGALGDEQVELLALGTD